MKNACSSSLVHDLLPRYRATFLRLRPKTLQDGNAKWSSSARALSTNFSTSPSLESDIPASLPELSLRDFMKKKGPSAHFESFNDIAKTELSLKFHIETYGCQMNLSDTEIVRSILLAAGHTETVAVDDAELIFQNTCAIQMKCTSEMFFKLRGTSSGNNPQTFRLNGEWLLYFGAELKKKVNIRYFCCNLRQNCWSKMLALDDLMP